MSKNLILLSALHKVESVKAVETVLCSIFVQPNFNKETTDILILTQADFEDNLRNKLKVFGLPIKYFILNVATPLEASSAKLRIFDYKDIDKYIYVLYLDTGALVNRQIDLIFDLDISPSKLYAIEEGWLSHPWWGGDLFGKHYTSNNKNAQGFSTQILLFKVSSEMRKLFSDILGHINSHRGAKMTDYLDQPYIVYNAITQNKVDTTTLKVYNDITKSFFCVPRMPHVYNKTLKINEFMKRIYTTVLNTRLITIGEKASLEQYLVSKRFHMKELATSLISSVDFGEKTASIIIPNNTLWGPYNGVTALICELHYGNQCHVLIFNSEKTFFISIRKYDLAISYGYLL